MGVALPLQWVCTPQLFIFRRDLGLQSLGLWRVTLFLLLFAWWLWVGTAGNKVPVRLPHDKFFLTLSGCTVKWPDRRVVLAWWTLPEKGSAELWVETRAKLYANLYFSWGLRALALNFAFSFSAEYVALAKFCILILLIIQHKSYSQPLNHSCSSSLNFLQLPNILHCIKERVFSRPVSLPRICFVVEIVRVRGMQSALWKFTDTWPREMILCCFSPR